MHPTGQMSEEAQELWNKNIKRFREDFKRKCDGKNKTLKTFSVDY
jgi:hypothetical protein